MALIELTKGYQAIVDIEDLPLLQQYNWQALEAGSGLVYAQARTPRMLMHRFLLGFPHGVVDHRDRNGLNNQRDNLRVTTQSMNRANSVGKLNGKTARFKGVYWNRNKQRWHAQIKLNGRTRYLGLFEDDVDAARAYDRAALELFGEYARLNFPESLPKAA